MAQKTKQPSYRRSVAEGYVPAVLCFAAAIFMLFVGDDLNHYGFAPVLFIASIGFATYTTRVIKRTKRRASKSR